MSKLILFLALLSLSFPSVLAQKVGWKKLGAAEKIWVLFHPFSANEAKQISQEAISVADSVAKAEGWVILKSGGEKDAFRHAYWMALLADRIGPKRAKWLGVTHEKKNRNDFEQGQKEEEALPDLKSQEMDLFNNDAGIYLVRNCENCPKSDIIKMVVSALENGELKIIKMDIKGNSLDLNGKLIPEKEWSGKWENRRVLSPSDFHLKAKTKVDP